MNALLKPGPIESIESTLEEDSLQKTENPTRRDFLGSLAALISIAALEGCVATLRNLSPGMDDQELADLVKNYEFGKVVRFGTEAGKAGKDIHHYDVAMPEDAFPIVSDYKSRYTTYGVYRAASSLIAPIHDGIDIAAPIGTPVLAPANGLVKLTGPHPFNGKRVVLSHGLNSMGKYVRSGSFHLDDYLVEEGQPVERGQIIGTVGITGQGASGRVPHNHFMTAEGIDDNFSQWHYTNPHSYWYNGRGKVTLFRPNQDFSRFPLGMTYPLPGRNDLAYFVSKLREIKKAA